MPNKADPPRGTGRRIQREGEKHTKRVKKAQKGPFLVFLGRFRPFSGAFEPRVSSRLMGEAASLTARRALDLTLIPQLNVRGGRCAVMPALKTLPSTSPHPPSGLSGQIYGATRQIGPSLAPARQPAYTVLSP